MDERLKAYLDQSGRVTRWPARRYKKDKLLILDYLASKFAPERTYTEREVNAVLNQFHTFEDWALLRRELYEHGYLNREKDGSAYWVTPKTTLY